MTPSLTIKWLITVNTMVYSRLCGASKNILVFGVLYKGKDFKQVSAFKYLLNLKCDSRREIRIRIK